MFRRLFSSRPLWFIGLAALLAFLPLPFGSNRPWASNLMGVLTGFLLLLATLLPQDETPLQPLPRKRLAAAMLLYGAALIWGAVQGAGFTPPQWRHPLWGEANLLTGGTSGAISVNPLLARDGLIRLLSYAGLFSLALRTARSPDLGKDLIRWLAWVGGFYALYGLAVQISGTDTILWYKKWAYQGFLSSTFVNKNSYATYGGLGLLCSMALVWQRIKHAGTMSGFAVPQKKIALFLGSLGMRDVMIFLLPVILLSAILLSGSRAGFVSCSLGCAAFLTALAANRRWGGKKSALLLVGLALCLGIFLAYAGDGLLMLRADDATVDEDTRLRLSAYRLTLQAIADNPWLGYGLGTFESAFRLYRDSSLTLWFQHAHNDYLETTLELGIPAAGSLFIAVALLVSCTFQGALTRRRREIFPLLGLAASLLIGVHSLADFSMQIPAVAGTFAVLLGLGVGQSLSTDTRP